MNHADLVARVSPAEWSGVAWRHIATGRSPLSGEGARIVGGRWNPPDSFAVLYLGASRDTAVAEFLRLAATQKLAPEQFLPRTLYRYEAALHRVMDLTDVDVLETLGIKSEQLTQTDVSVTQALGAAAFACDLEAVLAPSATGKGEVLAIYSQRLAAGSSVREHEEELWESVPQLDPDVES